MPRSQYNSSVFINCPFDKPYQRFFEAIVFGVHDCGFIARSAKEIDDGAQVRINKIYALIEGCKLGIHDLSRTELSQDTQLPRFNMPLELGLFLGARRYGKGKQAEKRVLLLDFEEHRYLRFISDIRGQDIQTHGNDERMLITRVRNWLRNSIESDTSIPSGSLIFERYERFAEDLPHLCAALHLDPDELTFDDYVVVVEEWLRANPW